VAPGVALVVEQAAAIQLPEPPETQEQAAVARVALEAVARVGPVAAADPPGTARPGELAVRRQRRGEAKSASALSGPRSSSGPILVR
jgi:hypothetical protein